VDGKFCGTLRVELQCDDDKVKTKALELAQRRIKERLVKNMCLGRWNNIHNNLGVCDVSHTLWSIYNKNLYVCDACN
ncbi:hypothetical protein, partial [Anaplasma phagocytophilum]|uniref:hypothetical protein n=1 Tax=Anaplasma phagocytophilum TaxID=948 RepID=UPI000A689E80